MTTLLVIILLALMIGLFMAIMVVATKEDDNDL